MGGTERGYRRRERTDGPARSTRVTRRTDAEYTAATRHGDATITCALGGVSVLFNVSTLLHEPVGGTRAFRVDDQRAHVASEDYDATVNGTVRMLRTERGVLVSARLAVRPGLECARCLAEFEQELTLDFDEEFIVEHDPVTGKPTGEISPDEFRIDEHQHLDLSEAVRQYEQSALPLRPVCKPDCEGLCPVCGQDLNERDCGCRRDEDDDRWASLWGLAQRLRTEESDGRTEG
jgi:DUF177 domain-containing protein